eukprot:9209275-Lingulodinium_polyedra.AAC.1
MGATEVLTVAMRTEIDALYDQHKRARPFGARLDSARARLRKAEEAMRLAANRIAFELQRHSDAEVE